MNILTLISLVGALPDEAKEHTENLRSRKNGGKKNM